MRNRNVQADEEYRDIIASMVTGALQVYPIPASSHPSGSPAGDLRPTGNTTPTVSVVIPARNEARNLPYVLRELPSFVSEVILVDGRSTDTTVPIAELLRPDAITVKQVGKGKGDALREGIAASTGQIVVLMDADGSTDPREIALFVAALTAGNADYVKGSRYLSGGGSDDLTPIRSLGNRLLNACANMLYGTRFTDFCYGFNAFWRECIPIIPIECDGFEVEAQLNCRAARAGLRILEVPSIERPRRHGQSNLAPVRDGWRILTTLLRERRWKPDPTVALDTQLTQTARSAGVRATGKPQLSSQPARPSIPLADAVRPPSVAPSDDPGDSSG